MYSSCLNIMYRPKILVFRHPAVLRSIAAPRIRPAATVHRPNHHATAYAHTVRTVHTYSALGTLKKNENRTFHAMQVVLFSIQKSDRHVTNLGLDLHQCFIVLLYRNPIPLGGTTGRSTLDLNGGGGGGEKDDFLQLFLLSLRQKRTNGFRAVIPTTTDFQSAAFFEDKRKKAEERIEGGKKESVTKKKKTAKKPELEKKQKQKNKNKKSTSAKTHPGYSMLRTCTPIPLLTLTEGGGSLALALEREKKGKRESEADVAWTLRAAVGERWPCAPLDRPLPLPPRESARGSAVHRLHYSLCTAA